MMNNDMIDNNVMMMMMMTTTTLTPTTLKMNRPGIEEKIAHSSTGIRDGTMILSTPYERLPSTGGKDLCLGCEGGSFGS